MAQHALSALMVEDNDVVSPVLLVVGDYLGAALTKGLNDLGCLWACAASHAFAVCAISATAGPGDRPGLAVCNEDSGFVRIDGALIRFRTLVLRGEVSGLAG